jgi:beta-lactamase regulating signal transducer with metallopeptidase domain
VLAALDRFSLYAWNAACSALAIACAALWLVMLNRQPARRVLIARCAILALTTLPFCAAALPRWKITPGSITGLDPPLNSLATWADQALPLLLRAIGIIFLASLVFQTACCIVAALASMRLIARAQAAREDTQNIYHAICNQLGIHRRPRLAVLPRIPSPMLLASFQPAILIPPSLDRSPNASSLRLVLAHELAHARNHDAWFWTLGAAIRGVWMFLPPVRWLVEILRIDQEFLADQIASQTSTHPRTYAHHLANAAANLETPQRTAETRNPFTWSRSSSLGPRILMLVACPYRIDTQTSLAWKTFALLGILPLLVLASLCAVEPRINQSPELPPAASPHGLIQISRLTIAPLSTPGSADAQPFVLPLDLPPRFTLHCELWTPSDADLASTSLLGLTLSPPVNPPLRSPDPASHADLGHADNPTPSRFHSILLVRTTDAISLSVNGQSIAVPPDRLSLAMTSTRLPIQPPHSRSVIIRDLKLVW